MRLGAVELVVHKRLIQKGLPVLVHALHHVVELDQVLVVVRIALDGHATKIATQQYVVHVQDPHGGRVETVFAARFDQIERGYALEHVNAVVAGERASRGAREALVDLALDVSVRAKARLIGLPLEHFVAAVVGRTLAFGQMHRRFAGLFAQQVLVLDAVDELCFVLVQVQIAESGLTRVLTTDLLPRGGRKYAYEEEYERLK